MKTQIVDDLSGFSKGFNWLRLDHERYEVVFLYQWTMPVLA